MRSIKDLLCYDIASCPPGFSLDRVLHIMKTHNILLFSSRNTGVGSLKGQKTVYPYILNKSKNNKVKFLDTDTEYGKELIHNLTKN